MRFHVCKARGDEETKVQHEIPKNAVRVGQQLQREQSAQDEAWQHAAAETLQGEKTIM